MMYNFYPRPPRGGRRSCLMISGVAKAISIHALREEGDDLAVNPKAQNRIFLSTPSARRATDDPCPWYCARSDFYPRPPRGGRHRPTPRPDPGSNFYPRPPRGGRLAGRANGWDTTLDFYPRPPRGGRPVVMPTHWLMGYFYPRPPRGGRPVRCCRPACSHHHFYPRPPRGGRRTGAPSKRQPNHISIHALREEGDCAAGCAPIWRI